MQPLRILCIEDSPQDFVLLERSLKKNFDLSAFKLIASEKELRLALSEEDWDLVLSDFNLPGFSALQALGIIKEFSEDLPFVLITGAIGEEAVVDFLKFGAQDVVLKSNLTRLNFVIERVFREMRIKQRAADAQSAKEQAIVAREEMLAIVSHDLRNPLTAIQLNAQAIETKIESGSEDAIHSSIANAKSIFRSSMRMKSLIADILDKVRLDAGTFLINKKTMSLKVFIKDVVDVFKPLAEEKIIEFDVHGADNDLVIELDFDRLFQILSNLIGNALKFTAPYGRIALNFEMKSGGLRVAVEDTGQGITREDQKKIFDKYWHNERSGRLGVGLGLTIVKEIIEAHGGHIGVESEKGRGSIFTFFIPAPIVEVVIPPQGATKSSGANRKIILVEDDDDLREVIEAHLISFGYQVVAMRSGQEALAYFDQQKDSPRMAILDYRLADMTGGDISEALRKKYPLHRIPVIFLSAETHLDSIAQKYKASTFLTKPLGIRDLKQAIEKYIDA